MGSLFHIDNIQMLYAFQSWVQLLTFSFTKPNTNCELSIKRVSGAWRYDVHMWEDRISIAISPRQMMRIFFLHLCYVKYLINLQVVKPNIAVTSLMVSICYLHYSQLFTTTSINNKQTTSKLWLKYFAEKLVVTSEKMTLAFYSVIQNSSPRQCINIVYLSIKLQILMPR